MNFRLRKETVGRLLETPAYRSATLVLCSMLVAVCCSAMGYFCIFTNLQLADDEGQMAMTVRNFLSGQPLYGVHGTGTIYGPYYYLYEWVAHALMGVQISTESARLVSLAFWIAGSLLALLLTYRATGSPIIALGAQFLVFRALAFIPQFPAHPQELCVALLAALGLAGYAQNKVRRMALLGALTGLLTATKINTGMFAATALAIACLYSARAPWLRRLAFLSFGAVALPILLMWGHRSDPWAERYAFVTMLSLAAAILVISRMELARNLEIRDFLIAAVAFAGVIAAGALFSLVHGGTIHGMIESTILTPRRNFSRAWFFAAYVRKDTVPWAVAGLAAAWWVATGRATESVVALLKLGFTCGVILLLSIDSLYFAPGYPSWERWGGYSLTVFLATPFLWLVAVPVDRSEAGKRDLFARASLALSAVVFVLYAYPVAASPHVRIATVLVIIVAGVCLSDGLRYLFSRWPEWCRPALVRAIAAGVALLLVWLSLDMAWQARRRYRDREPLNIAGMRRIHVPHDQGYAMRELVQRVSAQGCNELFTIPSMFSLNLWTGTRPINLDGGNWVNAASDALQEKLVESLSREPQTCVVYSRRLVDGWMPLAVKDVSSKPVIRFIEQNYKPEFNAFVKPDVDYHFMVRNGAEGDR
jgi:hypothetical protein